MRQELVIFVNGRRYRVGGERAFAPLSDWLREDLRLTGTKVVCAEGDCGSCTVLLGRPSGDRIEYQPVCGCIQHLFQLDGAHVVTIEGLAYDGAQNPVQEAFVACHGAQCGFCTPGFVVTLHSMLERGPADAPAVKRGLTGNLCRCTGYEPIFAAAARVDCSKLRRIEDLYPSVGMIGELREAVQSPVLITASGRAFFKPVSVRQAVEFRVGNPQCAVFAGGTDLGVQMNKRTIHPVAILGTGALPGWEAIEVDRESVTVAGGARLSAVQPVLHKAIPEFGQFLEWFGSPQIRNAGTLAGNLANASPIGDTLPPLFVLDAEITLTGVGGTRVVNINDFYVGYRKTVMRPDELITSIRVPIPRQDEVLRLYKASRRKDLDISTFGAAVWMRLREGVILDARLAYGGVGPTVIRMRQTEASLRGKRLCEQTMIDAGAVATAEIAPISDVRGSVQYRNLLAVNILRKFEAELTAAGGNGHA